MALEFIMNSDGTLGHGLGSLVTGGTFVIIGTLSVKAKAEGKYVYREPFTYTFSGGDFPGLDSGSVTTAAPQTLNAGATKTKDQGALVMRENDTGLMSVTGTVGGIPTAPFSAPVIIDSAGQTTGKAQ